MRLRTVHIALLLLPSLQLQAQLRDSMQMDEVRIEGRRKLREEVSSVQSIDSLLLSEYRTGELSELLSQGTTLYVKDYGTGSATVSLRGTSANHTKVYWNGMQINSPILGGMDMSLLPVFLLSEGEVKSGSRSLEAGTGGLGGNILLESSSKGQRQSSVEGFFSAQSFQCYRKYLGLRLAKGKWKSATQAYHMHGINDFPYRNIADWKAPIVRQKNASFTAAGAMQILRYDYSAAGSLEGAVWYQKEDRNLPPLMTTAFNDESQQDESLRGTLRWLHYGRKLKWSATAGLSDEKLAYQNSQAGIHTQSRFEHAELRPEVQWNFSRKAGAAFGILSFYDYARAGSNLTGVIQHREGSFVRMDYQPFSRWQTEGILRLETVNGGKPSPTGALGIFCEAVKNRKLVAQLNAGRNINFPSLSDLYWIPGGNPDLRPESAWQTEAGLSTQWKQKAGVFEGKITAYSQWIDDYIQWTPISGEIWGAANLRKVWSRGLEVLATQKWSWKRKSLELRGSYAYTRSVNGFSGELLGMDVRTQLIYVPVHKARALALFRWHQLEGSAECLFTGERLAIDQVLPSYGLINLMGGVVQERKRYKAELRAQVHNLFDLEYQNIAWRAMPGRWYGVSLIVNYEL